MLSGQGYGDEVKGGDTTVHKKQALAANENILKTKLRTCGRAGHTIAQGDDVSKYQDITYPKGDVTRKISKGQKSSLPRAIFSSPCAASESSSKTREG